MRFATGVIFKKCHNLCPLICISGITSRINPRNINFYPLYISTNNLHRNGRMCDLNDLFEYKYRLDTLPVYPILRVPASR